MKRLLIGIVCLLIAFPCHAIEYSPGTSSNIFGGGTNKGAVILPTDTSEGVGDFYNIDQGGVNTWLSYQNSAGGVNVARAIATTQTTCSSSWVWIITNSGTESWHLSIYNQNIPCSSGTIYTISFCIKTTAAKTIPILFREGDDDYTNYGLDSTFTTVANEWIRVQKTFTCNTTETDGQFTLQLGNLGNNWTMNIDGIQMEVGKYATSYIPSTATQVLSRSAEPLSAGIYGNKISDLSGSEIKYIGRRY